MLQIVERPTKFIHSDSIDNPEIAVGRVALAPIRKDEILLSSKIVQPSPVTGLSLQVAPGKRAVTLPVDDILARSEHLTRVEIQDRLQLVGREFNGPPIIGQQPTLFHGTLRENIRLGRPRADSEAIEAAARAARVTEFSRRLPDGLDTRIGEMAADLSRGQAQRVALARAFLRNAPLLLLDEPTAGLDLRNEQLVLEALQALCRHRTVLTVSHRLASIRTADRVLVLDGGKIVEAGPYDALMDARGRLHTMITRTEGAFDLA